MAEEKTFRQVLEETGQLVYTCSGVSMLPLLRQHRDLMVIKKVNPPYKCYDAVLFLRDNGQYVLHRILKVEPGRYYIIGDNCLYGEWVREDQILGLLTEVHRGSKIIDCADPGYCRFVRSWYRIYPMRKAAKQTRALAGRAKRAVKRCISSGSRTPD